MSLTAAHWEAPTEHHPYQDRLQDLSMDQKKARGFQNQCPDRQWDQAEVHQGEPTEHHPFQDQWLVQLEISREEQERCLLVPQEVLQVRLKVRQVELAYRWGQALEPWRDQMEECRAERVSHQVRVTEWSQDQTAVCWEERLFQQEE